MTDYAGLKRGLKRKINKAWREDLKTVEMDVQFLRDVSRAFDDLILSNKKQCKTAQRAVGAIEELQQTVEHYKGCADDWYKEACEYKAAIPKWISVEERLPELYQPVLVCVDVLGGNKMYGVDYRIDGVLWAKAGNFWRAQVTYWMPIPQPPEEAAEDGAQL